MLDPKIPYNDLPNISEIQFCVSHDIAKLAEDAHVAIEVLNYAVKSLPAPEILIDTLSLQEAKASSDIENISTTNDDIYKGVALGSFSSQTNEIASYKEALFIGFNSLKEKSVLSLSNMEEINAPINTKSHGIRTNLPNFNDLTRIVGIKPNGEKTTIYTPPHGKELLQSLLIDMLDFVYDDELYDLHPLIKIALAHYQFESIHPFRDGNGRTGRILNILFLCQKHYLDFPIIYASSYVTQNKQEYYRLLDSAKTTENLVPFVKYMLSSFKQTAEKTLHIVEKIKSILAYYTSDRFLSKMTGQREPLEQAIKLVFKKVYVKNADVVELGIHRQTSALYLDQLVDAGLLTKEKVGKVNIYKNIKLLELFDTESEKIK